MRKKVPFLFLFCAFSLYSQKKFSKEISFITENDLYTSTYNDRYYTNGMFLSFKYLPNKKNAKLEKKIFALGNWPRNVHTKKSDYQLY